MTNEEVVDCVIDEVRNAFGGGRLNPGVEKQIRLAVSERLGTSKVTPVKNLEPTPTTAPSHTNVKYNNNEQK